MVSPDNRRFARFRPALAGVRRRNPRSNFWAGRLMHASAANRKFGVAALHPFEIEKQAR